MKGCSLGERVLQGMPCPRDDGMMIEK